jgi:hypothetical protein
MLGHGGVDAGNVVLSEHEMQGGYVGKSDGNGLVGRGRQLVHNLHHSVSATCTQNVLNIRVTEGLVEVFGTSAFGTAETPERLPCMFPFSHPKSPRFQALTCHVEEAHFDASCGHYDVYSLFHNRLSLQNAVQSYNNFLTYASVLAKIFHESEILVKFRIGGVRRRELE